MARVLLALFPLLLLFAPRVAWVPLAFAIMLLVGKRLTGAREVARRRVEHDASV
jgi:hypothetical protein